jgi:hypothetical protein
MKLIFAALVISLAQPCLAQEPVKKTAAPQPVPQPVVLPTPPPRAWLGLRVVKPDETVTSHVPSLPPGIGFVIQSIDKDGPAAAAGLQEFDLLWKIGDQMLVNEAQLATLLRLSKPGDAIVLSGFRGGKPLEVKLNLGETPAVQRPFPGEMVEAAVLPGVCGGPMRVVNMAEKSASFATDDGRAVVRRQGDFFKVMIQGPADEVIFEGDVSKDSKFENVPEAWRRKVQVLCRTLDQALNGNVIPQRQPRPRVVPPPQENP